jgi:ATP-dependent exoDNAse (exonuclease V) beta subunit
MSSDAPARALALDPTRSFIVQAPAGSGKTELLTQRYLRLLATVEQPEQILAITFTRKAAAEMRDRILSAIEAAGGPPPDSAHKRETWELARAVREADAQRQWHLAEHPARLRIQTIDALNASLARRLPVLAGTGSALEPTDDPTPLYEAAVAQLLETLGESSPEARSLEALVVHLGNRVDRLTLLLCDLLQTRDQWLHPLTRARGSENLKAQLERTLAKFVERHLQDLCDKLTDERRSELWELTFYAANNLLRDPKLNDERKPIFEACASCPEPPPPRSDVLDAWRAMAFVFFKKTGELYQSVNTKQGFPTTDKGMKARMLAALAELAQDEELCATIAELRHLPSPVYSPEQWRILEALLDILPQAVAQLQIVFQQQAKADYVEGALRALQALGSPDEPTDLALAFDCRLQHLLVDEFQDTSFAQLDLLERLTAGWVRDDGRTVFCVGDPMQSIYRFRQAEVGLFLELKRNGLPNVRLEPLVLSSNFRSTRPIVDWVNQTFPSVLAPRDDPEEGAVRYSASVAAVDSDAGGVTVHPSLGSDDRAEARTVCRLVREALARDPQGSVAVLVLARSHVGSIATDLNAAGIPFRAVEIDPLRARPVVQDLIALTRALVHPADRTAWLSVLRAPWCGLALVDLHALVAGDRHSTVPELIEKAAERDLTPEGRARLERIAPVLRAALDERGRWSLREWVERAWNALGGPATLLRPQDLDDARSYLHRLEELDCAGDLEDVARLSGQLERLFANPRGESEARVEIMTIHKAKGLEFDTVILPSLHKWGRGNERRLLRWTRVAGPEGGIVFAPVKAEGQQPDPVYRWIEVLERDRELRERGRLLYVAATRARKKLHLLGSVQTRESEEGVKLCEPRTGTMLRMLWRVVEPAYQALLAEHADIAASKRSAARPVSRIRRLPLDWQAPAADQPVRVPTSPVTDIGLAKPEFDWVTETSRHVGTLVHRELERLVRAAKAHAQTGVSPERATKDRQMSLFETRSQPPRSVQADMESSLAALRSAKPRLMAELAELGVPPDRCEEACARAITAIEQTLSDPRGRWLLGLEGDLTEAESELALSGSFDGRIVEGIIDRTFVDREGVRWVIDFKTSTHEGGSLEAFLDAEVERYRGQLERYARLMHAFEPGRPVKAALYFPLLKSWREVPAL